MRKKIVIAEREPFRAVASSCRRKPAGKLYDFSVVEIEWQEIKPFYLTSEFSVL